MEYLEYAMQSSMPDGNYVTVRVAVIDKAGNSSNEFVFRFTFQTGVLPAPIPRSLLIREVCPN